MQHLLQATVYAGHHYQHCRCPLPGQPPLLNYALDVANCLMHVGHHNNVATVCASLMCYRPFPSSAEVRSNFGGGIASVVKEVCHAKRVGNFQGLSIDAAVIVLAEQVVVAREVDTMQLPAPEKEALRQHALHVVETLGGQNKHLQQEFWRCWHEETKIKQD